MELGCSLAELYGAELHVLHSLEVGELAGVTTDCISNATFAGHRARADRHIHAQLSEYDLTEPPQVHIVSDDPDLAILKHIEGHAIELLVVGANPCGGMTGMLMGNSAERLLRRVSCSVLAVKPGDFTCPVGIQ